MGKFWKQLKLLLWKNWILRKRHPIKTLIEIIWPTFLFAVMVAIRKSEEVANVDECHYPARAMPSAGVYPWMKSIVCDLSNPCFPTEVPSEVPGQINNPQTSAYTDGLISSLSLLSTDPSMLADLNKIPTILEEFRTTGTLGADAISLLGSYSSIADQISPLIETLSTCSTGSASECLFGSGPDPFSTFCGHPANSTYSSFTKMFTGESRASVLDVLPPINGNFCTNLIGNLSTNEDTRFFWDTFQPILLGKITYTPDTPLTRQIMKKANSSFEAISNLAKFGTTWSRELAPKLREFVESDLVTSQFKDMLDLLLDNDSIRPFLRSGVQRSQLERLREMLTNEDGAEGFLASTYANINQLVLFVTKILSCLELDKFEGHKTEYDMVNRSMALVDQNELWAGVVFELDDSDTSLPPLIKYKIRQDATTVTKTNSIQGFFWEPGSFSDQQQYYQTGFLMVQDLVDRAVTSQYADELGVADDYHGVWMQEFPYPCYSLDEFLEYLTQLLSLLMTLAWVYSVCIIVKNIVYEKEQRLKEVMKMMGLSNGVHWVAWFINAFTLMFISSILLVIILKCGGVTPNSNVFILILWLSAFAFATIAQCFLISCFFSKANLAAACAGIIYFVLYLPYNLVFTFNSIMTQPEKITACLLSSVAFGYGAGYVSKYEQGGTGIQFDNWASSPDPEDEMTFLISWVMMLADGAIYLILMWYVENVFPGEFGVPRPWYFFVQKSYWMGETSQDEDYKFDDLEESLEDDKVKVEEEPKGYPLGVSIDKLSKTYGNGKQALDKLSVKFYEGQITSFLGHNGAGKTTTMSILTGLFPATKGGARVYGDDIRTNMDGIRNKLGFCPQHNVLFGDLTVLEHMQLYAGLKAANGKSRDKYQDADKREIEQMIEDVGLPDKRDEMSRNLSGGMKRKLSVAVAFVGGSKCVILDEPTAGVDPYARRGIWDLLLKLKPGRTIVLSTHHMDEADLLGDRIAIISQGKLKCCGSPLFLKSCYGVGYYITLVKNNKKLSVASKMVEEKEKVSDELEGGLMQLVQSVVPVAKFHEETSRELTFILPYESIGEKFSSLLSKLDELGIGYGVTDTSLEEIFLNVAENPQEEDNDVKSSGCCSCLPTINRKKRRVGSTSNVSSSQSDSASTSSEQVLEESPLIRDGVTNPVFAKENGLPLDDDIHQGMHAAFDSSKSAGSYMLAGKQLLYQQFKALLTKRFQYARRNRKGIISQIVVPAVFVALSLVFTLIVPDVADQKPLELQPWMYGDTNSFFSNDDPTSVFTSRMTDAITSKPGLGNRCVPDYDPTNYNKDPVTCPSVDPSLMDWNLDASVKGLSKLDGDQDTSVCLCSDQANILLAECVNGTNGSPTNKQIGWTSDTIYNMTTRNASDWLVKTVDQFIQERYGGISLGETYHPMLNKSQLQDVITMVESVLNETYTGSLITQYDDFIKTENSKVWFDNSGYHVMPTWLNVLSNAALRAIVPTSGENYGIVVINHPLNLTEANVDLAALTQSITNTLVAISIVFALSFVPASFVLFLIEERVSKAKHLQFISGVNPASYWVATFLWDMLNYTVPAFITVLIFLCFQTDAYVSSDNLPVLICLLLLYGFAITPMMYPAAFYFDVPSTAYVVLTCANLFIGINTSIATFVLEALDNEHLEYVNTYLKKAFLIFPQYCLGRGLIDMALNQAYADAYAQFGIDKFKDPFSIDLVGRNLLALAVEGVFFFILALLFQYRFFLPRNDRFGGNFAKQTSEREILAGSLEDDDVINEKRRVMASQDGDEVLQIKKLTKIYTKRGSKEPLVAVDSMTVGVPKGECFGLLGVNGAGKTTTFQMLTGDTTPSAGDSYVCGHSVTSELDDVMKNIGYCPQFEALSHMLTGYEHMQLYARLRGVPPEEVERVCDWATQNFGLAHYKDKQAGTYSGGNKRKLSAAIAFIGKPSIVFLDEPTAGMDPLSRRFLWSRIGEAVKGGQCVVMTSHSMEECEALCGRLAIMVNGRFRCIGTTQHLKNKYGKGYTFSIKVRSEIGSLKEIKQFVSKCLPQAYVKEIHSNMIIYQIPLEGMKLAGLFDLIEKNKNKLAIEEYSISQTTLDEVFVGFAKTQTDGEEIVDVTEDNSSSSMTSSSKDESPQIEMKNMKKPLCEVM